MDIRSFVKKKKVLVSWLTSYLFILLVPVVVSCGIYFAAANIIENEINTANTSTLKHIQEGIDSKLSDVEELGLHIALNPRIQGHLYTNYSYENIYQYQVFEIINDLSAYYIINDFIDDFFIYYKNSGIVLSPNGKYDLQQFYSRLFPKEEISFDAWKSLLEEQNKGRYSLIGSMDIDGERHDSIAYMLSLPFGDTKQSVATVAVLIDERKIQDVINKGKWINQGAVFILDENNNIISSAQKAETLPYFSSDKMDKSSGLIHDHINGTDVVISYITSEKCSWKYVSVIPKHIFLEKARQIRFLSVVSLILCLIIGGFLSYFLARRNYNPISELVEALSQKTRVALSSDYNEFKFIHEAINNTIKAKEETDSRLRQQNNLLKSVFIAKILKGKPNPESLSKDLLDSFDISFISDEFAVILFSIEDYSVLFKNDDRQPDEEKLKLVQFIITNACEELCEPNSRVYTAEIDDMVACLVNFKESGRSNKTEVMHIAGEVQKFLQEKFHTRIAVSVSTVHHTAGQIPEAYNEAYEAMQYKMIMDCSTLISYEHIKNTRHNYDYPLESEYQLINFIRIGDYEKAKLILDEVFERNFNDRPMSIQMARCLLFDLTSTMIKTLNSISKGNQTALSDQLNPAKQLSDCKTVDEMKSEMTNTLFIICDYINKRKKSHNDTLAEQIIDFVNHNYQDINLSVSSIADKFNINPEYLSRFFKEQTGSGLLDFINKLRLEKAKLLFQEENLNIEDTASKVGYFNSNALIRVFKRYEGITPGQYKKNLQTPILEHAGAGSISWANQEYKKNGR